MAATGTALGEVRDRNLPNGKRERGGLSGERLSLDVTKGMNIPEMSPTFSLTQEQVVPQGRDSLTTLEERRKK